MEPKELVASEKKIGQIYPVVKDQFGNILDGFHRKEIDPNWKETTVQVVDPLHALRIRVHSNVVRREVRGPEKHAWIMEARKLLNPNDPMLVSEDEIAKELGMSQQWVSKYSMLPRHSNIDFDDSRKLVPYEPNMFYLSEIMQHSRPDSWFTIKDGDSYPTLKRRSWFFHENGREFSLREYARVQEFPNNFKFVGTKTEIKHQIGEAVPPLMAFHVAKKFPPSVAIELFAGCGGMAKGFMQANHKIVWMNEWNRICCHTYKINFPNVKICQKDIRQLTVAKIKSEVDEKVELIFGGPPCQGFSLAGLRFRDDPRNELYKEFLRVVEGLSPEHFVIENVPGIRKFKDQILKDIEGIGYEAKCEIVKGEDIGMRQKRHRVFFFGEA